MVEGRFDELWVHEGCLLNLPNGFFEHGLAMNMAPVGWGQGHPLLLTKAFLAYGTRAASSTETGWSMIHMTVGQKWVPKIEAW